MNNNTMNNTTYMFLILGAWITAILVFALFILRPEAHSTEPTLIIGYALAGVSLGIIILGMRKSISNENYIIVDPDLPEPDPINEKEGINKVNFSFEELEQILEEELPLKAGGALVKKKDLKLALEKLKINNWVIKHDTMEILEEVIRIKDKQNGSISKKERAFINILKETKKTVPQE